MNRLGDLKTYLPFAKNSFQQLISYKANVIMFIFTVTVIMFYKFFGFISIGRILIYFLSIILGVFILAISLGYCLLK